MKTTVEHDKVTLTFDPTDLHDIENAKKYMEGFLSGRSLPKNEECVYCNYEKKYGVEIQHSHGPLHLSEPAAQKPPIQTKPEGNDQAKLYECCNDACRLRQKLAQMTIFPRQDKQ